MPALISYAQMRCTSCKAKRPWRKHMSVGTDTHGLRIAIVGGGIGGLTLALALRQRGMTAEVFEQAPQLTEIGAAVALSANSTRELRRLGVLDGITAAATEPSELIYRSWQDGRRIAAFPVHEALAYQKRFGAPYYGIHRADLQKVLSGALGGAGLHLGYRLVDLVDQGDTIRLESANGRSTEADLVIGADGVRSLVRRYVTGGKDAIYSGTSAFRGIVPVDRLPPCPTRKPFSSGWGRTPICSITRLSVLARTSTTSPSWKSRRRGRMIAGRHRLSRAKRSRPSKAG